MVALQNYQLQFNGYTIGAFSDVILAQAGVSGLRGMPSIKNGDVSRARRHGSFPGLNYFDDRIVQIPMEVWANAVPSGLAVEQVVTAAANAFNNIENPAGQLPLYFMLPGWSEPRLIFCRPSRYDAPVDQSFTFGKPSMTVELTAPDPLVYSNTLHTASAGLPSPTAGMTFPATFPIVFGASTGGSMQVANSGNYTTPPTIVIQGPMLNPLITLGGLFFGVTLQLGVSDQLVINMNARTVTLNGTASRSNAVLTGSAWLGIPPGTSTMGVQSSDATSAAGTFTCQWRDAWGNL